MHSSLDVNEYLVKAKVGKLQTSYEPATIHLLNLNPGVLHDKIQFILSPGSVRVRVRVNSWGNVRGLQLGLGYGLGLGVKVTG